MISKHLRLFLGVAAAVSVPCGMSYGQANAKSLQTFTIQENLNHQWDNEIVHFNFNVAGNAPLKLTDDKGNRVPAQFTHLVKKGKRTSGAVWTVVSLPPGGRNAFHLKAALPLEKEPASDLKIVRENAALILGNGNVAIKVPQWPGVFKEPVKLEALPTPVLGVRGKSESWLSAATWFNDGEPLQVAEASTTVLERGPIRAMVQLKIVFTTGKYHRITFELGAQQDLISVREESTLDAPKAGWRLSFREGLHADHVFWHNQLQITETARRWSLVDTAVTFDKDPVIANLRPWSFWWLFDVTPWAGFYQAGDASNPFVGVVMLRPSRWLPGSWEGFDRTSIPIRSHPDGELDIPLAFLAQKKRNASPEEIAIVASMTKSSPEALKGKEIEVPARREWGITVGTVAEHVLDPEKALAQTAAEDPRGTAKMRRLLIKHSEFPLDEVKEYGFDFKTANSERAHPFLVVSKSDVERVRRQAVTNPFVKAHVDAALEYITDRTGSVRNFEKNGAEAFYVQNYSGNDLTSKLPEAYLGSDDPVYGKMLAAVVKINAQKIRGYFLEAPVRPLLGAYGPWFSEGYMTLLLDYDLIADSGFLSPQEKRSVYNTLIFGAYQLSHPDFWNPEHGTASANPNMTSSIALPTGLLGLYLDGHPLSKIWVKQAEAELKNELDNWVSKSDGNMEAGAWVENPGYECASLDGIMLLSAALRNVRGEDIFARPQFKAMMRYFGTLLTPPDRRYPPQTERSINYPTMSVEGVGAPATYPSIGDMYTGTIAPYNGWMAAALAKSDPQASKEQQFYWKAQNYPFQNGNRAKGLTLALCDADLPAEAPRLSAGFQGFGSVLRNSWTDPKATYLAHRTGANLHHYHDDFNEIVLYSKGAPLCLDFGNMYEPVHRREAWFHNRVSFDVADSPQHWPSSGVLEAVDLLPKTLDYSRGRTEGGGGQRVYRHVLLVKSSDMTGANYAIVRDKTVDGQPNQQFYWNLFCLSKKPQINGNVVHFPGQFDVDLDVHVLSPTVPKITEDQWAWKMYTGLWGVVPEEQFGMRVQKSGSTEDYLAVLYPRATGQDAARIQTLAEGAALDITHMEGRDMVLISPEKPTSLKQDEFSLRGEIAFARRYTNGALRLVTVLGNCNVAYGEWALDSDGATAVEIRNGKITGESSGGAHTAKITLPPDTGKVSAKLDGKAVEAVRQGASVTVALPAGVHNFELEAQAI